MNRKVLLIEPNYKNKYPPMGLMKLATYYRTVGDDVRFYKGDMRSFAVELICDDLINHLSIIFPEDVISSPTNWKDLMITGFLPLRLSRNEVSLTPIFHRENTHSE